MHKVMVILYLINKFPFEGVDGKHNIHVSIWPF